jgi:hypothetical protein
VEGVKRLRSLPPRTTLTPTTEVAARVTRGWGHPGTGHRTVSVTPCRATWRRVCGARREHKSPGQPLAGGRARFVDARCTTLGGCRHELPPAGGAPRRAPSRTVVRWSTLPWSTLPWSTLPWWNPSVVNPSVVNPSVVADSPAGTAHRQSSQDGGGHGSTVHPRANDHGTVIVLPQPRRMNLGRAQVITEP